ncbi:MAG TPA: cofactor-independent phosphoglycerate mutase [Candidatus Syntrophoarchaeum butanivorans]|uniref:2,3-bisphosphoglycerate-independent phosphoglycerate mutase n=2 Tax=Candidatus Syntropharchaeum butanivorans TaxID=1839936 RepID=A0A1F2P653_9EURY|nr:MAG: putative homoserine kinase [Candidatus Syntrophoarchaeum butanivorans]HEC57669.1 cofactor-independent phosphoglycerate mutase [Candidatus Syntrophoarchaeum butanivorans]
MRYLILIGDGMADLPLDELHGRTILQAADTPNMDLLAKEGLTGLFRSIPEGMPAGSDIATLSILGYDPEIYHPGRGALEAVAIGINLKEGDVAFRCNLITVEDGKIADYAAGHIRSEEAEVLIEALRDGLSCDVYPGVGYRHILVLNGDFEGAGGNPPHDIMGRKVMDELPKNPVTRDLILRSRKILEEHPINIRRRREGKNPANMIWLWGEGRKPIMPRFFDRFRVRGAVISAVDIVRGIGRCIGFDLIDVPGATGYFDTNYRGKAEYAIEALRGDSCDLVFLHVEAPDEAGHAGSLEEKLKAVEAFDHEVLGTVLDEAQEIEQLRILLMPDHPTPLKVRTHTRDPVPFCIWSKERDFEKTDDVVSFDEHAVKNGFFGLVEGDRLIRSFIEL